MRHIDTAAEARVLVREFESGLARPIVVISNVFDGGYIFDPDVVASRVGWYAEVVTIFSGDPTVVVQEWNRFARVFNGAARVFGTDGTPGQIRFSPRDTVEDLIGDVPMSLSLPESPLQPEPTAVATIEHASDEMRVLGRLDSGELVRVEADHLDELHRHVGPGDRVEGVLRDHVLMLPHRPFRDDDLPDGSVTLGLVVRATSGR